MEQTLRNTPAYQTLRRKTAELLSGDRRRVLIAIDGRCGSGKTTLASLLAEEFGGALFHMDDFYLREEQRTPERLAELGAADQGKTLRYMFAQENENVGKVNAFNNLLAHNSEYLYFNTDHHWTALGAYYTYQSFCETAGFEAVPLSEFTEWNMGAFTGTWYYSVNNRNLKTDEVIALVPPGNDDIHMEILGYPDYTSVIVDETEADSNMKYNCFIAGDNQLTVITNDALPDAPDCLVIKDSFGNPFTVYLTQHYHRIYVLDYRKNFTPVSTVAEQYGVQDVVLPLLENLMK